MSTSHKSLLLSLRNVYEVLAISVPTVVEAARGELSRTTCDERLESFSSHILGNLEIDLSVHGKENVARGQTYVVMSNHQSHYDVPVLFSVLGGNMRMVAKQELFALPVFGRALRESGFISVDRKNRERAVASLAAAKKQLAGGTHIWIAPEGTRSPDGTLLPFKKGGFMLAMDLGLPILPITISGTRDALRAKGIFSMRSAQVKVTIHSPVKPEDFASPDPKTTRDALIVEVRNRIASAL